MKKFLSLLFILTLLLGFIGLSRFDHTSDLSTETTINENGTYLSKDDVALYIHTFHKLPANYLTKKQASAKGWKENTSYVGDLCESCALGGDRFANREGLLPGDQTYYECDVNYGGKKRNEQRLIYTSSGIVYYSDDHYNSFVLLYGAENEK